MTEHVHDASEEVPGPPSPAHEYRFDFLYDTEPVLESTSLQSLLAPHFRSVAVESDDRALTLTFEWGEASERVTLASEDLDPVAIATAVEQSWQWRDAEAVASRLTRVLRLTHHLGGDLPLEGRIAFLRRAVSLLIEHLAPVAVHLVESCQLMAPAALHEAFTEDPYDPLFGFMNIRMYKVEGHERGITAAFDETIMDTLGLHALGLPDLQMHFKHLEASMVARLLDDTAHYLLEKGAVIEPGHSLRGFADGQKFSCSYEGSILDPWRLVVEVDPGKPYSLKQSQSIVV